MIDTKLHYEELGNNIFRKKDKEVKEVKTEKKLKNTLSVYTYLNWKRFGVSVAIDDGIKVNIAWFETNIKFEKK